MSRIFTLLALIAVTSLVSACGGPGKLPGTKVGKPYVINGKSYYPSYDPTYDKTGVASWYGPGFHGKYTASGEVYDQDDLTAAHPTLPMPSLVRVTNLKNGKSLIVRVNDRGPFAANRLIDLSKASAKKLDIKGLAEVRVQFLETETQHYIAMAAANEGKIIPMAEYHRRAGEFAVAKQLDESASDTVNADAIPAPMMTVAQNDIPTQGGPVTLHTQETLQQQPSATAMPRLFISEAQAAEPVGDMAPAAGHDEVVFPREAADSERHEVPAQPMVGDYTIQVGAYASENNVRKLVEKLQPIGETMIDQIEMGGRLLWRVRLGGFAERDYASEVLQQVRALAPDAKVVRR